MELSIAKQKIAITTAALFSLVGCAEPSNQPSGQYASSGAMAAEERSPWHSLTGDEITEAVNARFEHQSVMKYG